MAGRQLLRIRLLSRLRPALVSSRKLNLTVKQINPACTVLPQKPLVASIHTTVPCMNENIFNIQDEDDFTERVMKNSKPVIVDFTATWCGPCKILGPRLESMVTKANGDVQLAKVDIDDNQELAIEHGVQAVPTVLGMKDGKVVDKFVGVIEEDVLNSFIEGLVK